MQWLMLQQAQPEDFVIATGQQVSVREFVTLAGRRLGLNIEWSGKGLDERGHLSDGRCIVEVDPGYFRPTEVETLLGDASKAHAKLGWSPKISFEQLVDEMVDADLAEAEGELRAASTRRRSLY
jgi:GDPmannose 4,6-dehydratase